PDEYRRVRRCDGFDQANHAPEGRAPADDAMEARSARSVLTRMHALRVDPRQVRYRPHGRLLLLKVASVEPAAASPRRSAFAGSRLLLRIGPGAAPRRWPGR